MTSDPVPRLKGGRNPADQLSVLMRKHWFVPILILALACGAGLVYHWTHSSLTGVASYYADRFNGRRTANGEIFDVNALTAAHRTLPFNTRVRVTNVKNGKSVVVRINDRGPYVDGRVIDLAPAAARKIDLIAMGIAPVKLEILSDSEVASGR